ncbi:MAG: TIGR03905 family protein [Clostridiales bacterium 43-6]|nr:MAG: TIGR03905 family protein [Clostridiales bacterium 43-6]
MKQVFKPQGVCARAIDIEVEDNIVKSVKFQNGCDGNAQGLSKLVEGLPVELVIEKLQGIKCGFKSTSCPDQLAKALKKMNT